MILALILLLNAVTLAWAVRDVILSRRRPRYLTTGVLARVRCSCGGSTVVHEPTCDRRVE